MPFKDYTEAEIRLLEPSPLTEAEIRDLMKYNREINDKGQRRLYVELSLQNLAAVQKFEQSSGRLSQRLLCLTWVIAGLTIVMTIATVWVALPTFHRLCVK